MKLSSSERCRLPAGVCGLTCGTVLHQMLSQKNEKYGYMYRAHNEQLMALLWAKTRVDTQKSIIIKQLQLLTFAPV